MTNDKDLQNAIREAYKVTDGIDETGALAIQDFYTKATGKQISFEIALAEWRMYDALCQAIRVVLADRPAAADAEAMAIIKQLYEKDTGHEAPHEVVLFEWQEYKRTQAPRKGREFENN